MYEAIGAGLFVMGTALGFGISRIGIKDRYRYIKLEALAHANSVRQEAEMYLEQAKSKIDLLENQRAKEHESLILELQNTKNELSTKEQELESKLSDISIKQQQLDTQRDRLNDLETSKQQAISTTMSKLENIASFTQDEAKELILQNAKESSKADIATLTKKYLKIAKEDAQKKANYILAQATTRYAGEFAGERLMNTVGLPTDNHKGRIIGKEGRNIKTLEQLLGVDIIIDETPGVVLVSSFNLYRRAIATRVIELLVEDGRIHPGRIEEVHEKVQKEFDNKIYEEGESVVLELGLFPMSDELISLIGKLKFRASYGQNALAHSLEVARLAKIMAAEMGGDEKLAMRAGLLHDIGKALTQDFGGSHVDLGADLCRKYNEHPVVINAIYAHHGHEEINSVESAAVCAADTLSAARPGARREVLESFTQRVKDIESIAMENEGVIHAYAINAGREIRVFVDGGKIDDDESALMSSTLAKKIEDRVQYPGEIKVNVIRETRSVNYAK